MVGNSKLAGSVVLITGAGRGIGRAAALAFAGEGARLSLCARTAAELAETAEAVRRTGADVLEKAADVSSPEQVDAWIAETMKRFEKIDLLINNASILGPRTAVAEYPVDAWRQVLDVNVTGLFLPTKAALRASMLARGGAIINLSSGAGRSGRANWGAYAASKFAVEGLTQVLADELRGRVRVNALNPGGTRTKMRAEAYPDEDPARLRSPETVAKALVALAVQTCSGQSFDIDAEGRLQG